MITARHQTEEQGARGPVAGGAWLYVLLLAIQALGAAIILWKGVPIYRQMVADPSAHEPLMSTLVWSVGAVVLIQSSYWPALRLGAIPVQRSNALLGHIVLFLARLSLILGTATFSVIFLAQPQGLKIPLSRLPALLVVLFSLFCFSQELDRLGRAFLSPKP